MTVKVVTDSTSDLSPQVAQEMGITVVPVYVRFGTKLHRDGADLSHDEFYHKLVTGPAYPITSEPTPEDFAHVYSKLSQEADGIISIHISSRLSDTHNSALKGRALAQARCRIDIVDSQSLSMGLGLITMAAARVAKSGGSLPAVREEVGQAIRYTSLLGVLDTVKYLFQGGRIGKVKALLGTLFNVKPMLTLRDGEIVPAGLARTRAKGIERLFDFVKYALNVQEVAIVYSTTPDEASLLRETIGSLIAEERIHVARLGPALGAHAGPGALILVLRGEVGLIRQEAGEGELLKERFSLSS